MTAQTRCAWCFGLVAVLPYLPATGQYCNAQCRRQAELREYFDNLETEVAA